MDSINEILEARVKDKDDAFTAYDKAAIMSIFNKVNVADAQAYNTLPSLGLLKLWQVCGLMQKKQPTIIL